MTPKHHDIKARRQVRRATSAQTQSSRVETIRIDTGQHNRVQIPVRRVIDFRPYGMRQKEAAQPAGIKSRLGRMLGTMVVALAILSTSSFGGTLSFYNDYEPATDNVFTAGLVDFVLIDTPFANAVSTTDWTVDVTPHELSNPFYYYASSTDFVGNSELCSSLTVTATLDGEVMYSGLLTDMFTGTTTVIDTWTFDFDNFEQFAGQSCKFFVEYNSWQTRHGLDQGGYSDTERVMYTITVPSLLLGKVYFTDITCDEETASTTGCNDTQTWVELYNRTNVDIDTAGWSLCASDSCFTIVDSQYIDITVIKAGEYGIVAADPDIHTQISLPWGVTPLITDNVWFTSDLDTAGDMLQLVDPNALVIDQVNWGMSTTSWTNYNADLWADDSVTATSGHALARLPVGFDSNAPSDWALLGVPTLTIDDIAPQPLQPGEEVTIEYTAVNTNGLSEDLRIDMYLFEVDDTLHVIELDVENTGSYSFVLPDDLNGPIRIKPVVTSPENVLLNARAVSGYLPIATTSAGTFTQEIIVTTTTTTTVSADLLTVIAETASSTETAEPRRSSGGGSASAQVIEEESVSTTTVTATASTTSSTTTTQTASTTTDSLTEVIATSTTSTSSVAAIEASKEPLSATSSAAVASDVEIDSEETEPTATTTSFTSEAVIEEVTVEISSSTSDTN